jgi:hypothetical protein
VVRASDLQTKVLRELMMRKYNHREERIVEQVESIVKSAPPEQDKREGHVIDRCLSLKDEGFDQSDYRQIEERARRRLHVQQWAGL